MARCHCFFAAEITVDWLFRKTCYLRRIDCALNWLCHNFTEKIGSFIIGSESGKTLIHLATTVRSSLVLQVQ